MPLRERGAVEIIHFAPMRPSRVRIEDFLARAEVRLVVLVHVLVHRDRHGRTLVRGRQPHVVGRERAVFDRPFEIGKLLAGSARGSRACTRVRLRPARCIPFRCAAAADGSTALRNSTRSAILLRRADTRAPTWSSSVAFATATSVCGYQKNSKWRVCAISASSFGISVSYGSDQPRSCNRYASANCSCSCVTTPNAPRFNRAARNRSAFCCALHSTTSPDAATRRMPVTDADRFCSVRPVPCVPVATAPAIACRSMSP